METFEIYIFCFSPFGVQMKKEKIEVRTWQLKQITEALEKALVNKPKKFWHVEFPGKTLSWLKIFEDKLPCDSKDSGSFNPSNLDKTSIDFVSVDEVTWRNRRINTMY